MESIQRHLLGAVGRLIEAQPLSRGKVDLAWRVAVGGPLARVTVVQLDATGVLHVRAQGPIWRRELQRSSAMVLQRLQTLLGKDAIVRLDLTS